MWETTQRHPGDYPHQLIFATLMIHDYTQYDHTSARTQHFTMLFHDYHDYSMMILHSFSNTDYPPEPPPICRSIVLGKHHGYPNDPMAMMPRLPSAVA